MNLSRRNFILASVGTLEAFHAWPQGHNHVQTPKVCIFSKHLQFLNYAGLAKTSKELGLDGVDLTVREGGHVLPDRVDEDLPKAVGAIRDQGLDVPMITTRFNSGDDIHLRDTLRAASALGIKFFRVGGHKYERAGDPIVTLKKVLLDLQGLSKIAEEFGMFSGYHNHSGYDNVGAPVWDLKWLIDSVNSQHLGSNLDLGHTTVEGAYGDWQITARAMAPHVKMIALKDFTWKGDKPEWCPLGSGIVKTVEILKILHQNAFSGPLSLHFEYRVSGGDSAMLDEIRAAVIRVREDLKYAGYSV